MVPSRNRSDVTFGLMSIFNGNVSTWHRDPGTGQPWAQTPCIATDSTGMEGPALITR